ncbi:MAG TPA: hypothetical protein VG820_03350 [Fimbriimonadaceae bacterium]|nr:hypothetical protein [Fimbriimonadaceae bacterium]
MSTFDHDDLEMQDLMSNATTTQEAPAELKERIRAMAAKTVVRHPSVWPARLAMVGAGALAIGAFAIFMTPAKASAKSFALVMNAIDKTNAMELSVNSSDGHRFIIAVVDGKFGMRTEEGAIMQFDSKGLQIYDPKDKTVTELEIGGFVDPKEIAKEVGKGLSEGLKEMDIKKMLADFEAKYGKGNIQISPIVHRFGKSTYDVTMQKPGDPEMVQMTINADTDLPERIEVHKGQDEDKDAVIELKFGNDVDVDLANPTFPVNAKHVNLNIGNLIEKGLKNLPDFGQGSNGDKDKE